jgi:hypothetical protein
MHKAFIVIPALLALGFCGWTVMSAIDSTPNEISLADSIESIDTEPDEIHYICTETGALSVNERRSTPAVNPKTGRRTLVQALYCCKCRKWYRAPPVEMAERSPRGPVCPVTGSRLYPFVPLESDES